MFTIVFVVVVILFLLLCLLSIVINCFSFDVEFLRELNAVFAVFLGGLVIRWLLSLREEVLIEMLFEFVGCDLVNTLRWLDDIALVDLEIGLV
jgi:hypothetical protein